MMYRMEEEMLVELKELLGKYSNKELSCKEALAAVEALVAAKPTMWLKVRKKCPKCKTVVVVTVPREQHKGSDLR